MRKKLLVTIAFLLSIFMIMDYFGYYYGMGYGFFSKKIPPSYKIVFSGSNLGYDGVKVLEEYAKINLVRNQSSIHLESTKESIKVKKMMGYYFSNHDMIVKILNQKNKILFIQIIPYPSSSKYYGQHYFKKIHQVPKGYNYVNTNKSLSFYLWFSSIKNMILILMILIVALFLPVALMIKAIKILTRPKNKTRKLS